MLLPDSLSSWQSTGSSTGHLLAALTPAAQEAKSFGEVRGERFPRHLHWFRVSLKAPVIRNPVSPVAVPLHRPHGGCLWPPSQAAATSCCPGILLLPMHLLSMPRSRTFPLPRPSLDSAESPPAALCPICIATYAPRLLQGHPAHTTALRSNARGDVLLVTSFRFPLAGSVAWAEGTEQREGVPWAHLPDVIWVRGWCVSVPPHSDKTAGYCDSQGKTCEPSKNMPGRKELMRASEKDAHMVFLMAKQQPVL